MISKEGKINVGNKNIIKIENLNHKKINSVSKIHIEMALIWLREFFYKFIVVLQHLQQMKLFSIKIIF